MIDESILIEKIKNLKENKRAALEQARLTDAAYEGAIQALQQTLDELNDDESGEAEEDDQ